MALKNMLKYSAMAEVQSRKLIEIWMLINWSRSRNYKFSSKFFPTFV